MATRTLPSLGEVREAAENRRTIFKWGMVLPALLFAIASIVYPMVFLLRLSVSEDVGGAFVGIENYATVLTSATFHDAIVATFVFSFTAVGLELIFGTVLALAYNSVSRFERFTQTALLIPMVLTTFAVGLMFRWFFSSDLGVINYLLETVGLATPVWLSDPQLAMVTVIVADVWQWTPFVFILMYAGLQTIPESLIEAAKVDGASRIQRFRYIILPQVYPVLLITALIRLIMAFKGGDKIFAMTGGGPGGSTKTLTMLIYENGFSFLNTARAAAMSVLFLVFIIVVSNVFIVALSRVDRGR
jgi:multiple sugar transport system permease protein